MDDLRCPVCKKLRFGPGHTCDPLWECTSEDPRGEHDGFGGSRIRASSADDAAERYVLENVSSSGDWAGENEVYVRKVGTDVVSKFVVEIELTPSASSAIVESFEIETCWTCGKMEEKAAMQLHDELGLHCRDCQLKHGSTPEPENTPDFPTPEQWEKAKKHLDTVMGHYEELRRTPGVNVEFALVITFFPLLQRWERGERSQYLYEDMLAVE